jgi:hypothetical protein
MVQPVTILLYMGSTRSTIKSIDCGLDRYDIDRLTGWIDMIEIEIESNNRIDQIDQSIDFQPCHAGDRAIKKMAKQQWLGLRYELFEHESSIRALNESNLNLIRGSIRLNQIIIASYSLYSRCFESLHVTRKNINTPR